LVYREIVHQLHESLIRRDKERTNLLQENSEARKDKSDLRIRVAYAQDFQIELTESLKRLGGLLKNPLSKKSILEYQQKIKPGLERNRAEAIQEEVASGSKSCVVSIPRVSDNSKTIRIDDSDSE